LPDSIGIIIQPLSWIIKINIPKTTNMKNLVPFLFAFFLVHDSAGQLIPPSGNILWLMADRGVYNDNGITNASNGHLVQVWADQSGNNNSFRQDTLGQRPVLVNNVLCSRPVIRFDVGRRTYLSSSLKLSGAFTVFIVFISPSITGNPETLLSIKSFTNSYTEILCADHPSYRPVSFMAYMPGSVTGGTMMNSVGNAATFSPAGNLFTMTYNGGSSTSASSYAANYDASAAPVLSSGLFGRLMTDSTTIGGRAPGQNYSFLSGDIAEIIVYDHVISNPEIEQVEGYLVVKYGLFNNCSPLGMQLSFFDVTADIQGNQLTWEVVEDGQVSSYEIEQSTDGMLWNVINSSSPLRNGLSRNLYSYTHRMPLPGLNYYRLKIISQDGKIVYSAVRKVAGISNDHTRLVLFSNPTSSLFTIGCQMPGELTAVIFNIYGQALLTQRFQGSTTLDLGRYPPGVYYVTVHGKSATITKKIIRK
jgi:hypothetical protein